MGPYVRGSDSGHDESEIDVTNSDAPKVVTQDGETVTPTEAIALPGAELSDKDLARRVAFAHWLEEQVKAGKDALRAEQLRRSQAAYLETGDSKRAILAEDGRRIGSITLSTSKDSFEVSSEADLTNWLALEYGDVAIETVVQVRPAFLSTFKAKGVVHERNAIVDNTTGLVREDLYVTPDLDAIDPESGEIVPGVTVLPEAVVDPKVKKVVPGMALKRAPRVPEKFSVTFEKRPTGAKSGGGRDIVAELLTGRSIEEFGPDAIVEAPQGGAR